MKLNFFYISLVVSTLCFLSCKNETQKEEKINCTLYAMGTRSTSSKVELLFTGDDIKSFNPTTGEIVFTDQIIDKLNRPNEKGTFCQLTFYFEEEPLFNSIPITTAISSLMYNNLVLISMIYDSKFYFTKGYPEIAEVWDDDLKNKTRKEREEQFKKYEAGWDIFINYLKDAGKLIRQN